MARLVSRPNRWGGLAALCAASSALVLLFSGATLAQRREGDSAVASLSAKLPQAVRFGEVTVPAGAYRLFVSESTITLADPISMVTVATLVAQASTNSKSISPTLVEVQERGQEVRLVVLSQTDIFTAVGQKVAPPKPASEPKVEYAAKSNTVFAGPTTEIAGDEALVDGAFQRYQGGIKPCGENAHRSHWTTDDARFVACVCPILEKWRMPKVKAQLRVHKALVKGRAGVSFTVGPDGRTRDCRVWVGAQPPAEPTESPAAAPAGATPAPPVAEPAAATPAVAPAKQ
jgi:hypothetical protein